MDHPNVAPYSFLHNPIELVLSVFKGHVKHMLREEMRELIAVVPSNGMSMTEQRMQRLENIAGRAIANVTPAMLVQFANRVERY